MRLVALDVARHAVNAVCQAVVIFATAHLVARWLCTHPAPRVIPRTLFGAQAALALTSACLTASLSVARVLARWQTRHVPELRPKTCACCQFCDRAADLVATAGALVTVAVAHIADRLGDTAHWAELGFLHTLGLIFVLVPLPGCCSEPAISP